jgi:hypothetical protein
MAATLTAPAEPTYVGFQLTGTDRSGRRFKRTYGPDGAQWAFGVNLWRGTVWGILPNGSRKALRRVCN